MKYLTSDGILQGVIQLPTSKSLSNRALMIRALCNQHFDIHNLSDSSDTLLLHSLLESIQHQQDGSMVIDAKDAGTVLRFLVAFLAIQENRVFILTGSPRLCERPMASLVESLQSLGAQISYLEKQGFAPLRIEGRNLQGGLVQIRGDISSQFISALCLIAPQLNHGLEIEIIPPLVSLPYIKMTLGLMDEMGVQHEWKDNQIRIHPQIYLPRDYTVEGDWSSATFIYAMAIVSKTCAIELKGLCNPSLQGDAIIAKLASGAGVESRFDHTSCFISKTTHRKVYNAEHFNLGDYPDLAVPLIVASALITPKNTFSGLHHLEWKESKRVSALQQELIKIGLSTQYKDDRLQVVSPANQSTNNPISMHTHHDHRIAMAMTILCIAGYTITLDDMQCVTKSFPDFFQELSRTGILTITE